MAQDKHEGGGGVPWHAVNDVREPVAPSKPAFPTTGSAPAVPREVKGDDGDIIAPVSQPDSEEIHPTIAPALWAGSAAPATTPAQPDPVRELGESAVRQASLSASGAIPVVAAASRESAAQPRTFEPEDGVAPRPAWFAGDPRSNAPEGAASWSATPAYVPQTMPTPTVQGGEAASDGATPSATTPDAGAGSSAGDTGERPVNVDSPAGDTSHATVGTPDEPTTAAGAAGSGTPPTASAPDNEDKPQGGTPWYRGALFLTIVGLVVLAGIAWAVYATVFADDDVEVAAPQVVEVPATPTLDPIALESPSAFLAALPATVGVYAMTDATVVDEDDAGLDTRTAEIDDVTYRGGDTTLQLRAIQHYTAEDATAQYEALAADGTDPQPVTVAGTEAGERVTLEGDPASYVWRNGTAVFVLSGPADQLEDFWIQFPL